MVLPAPSFNMTFDLAFAARFELGYSLHLNKNYYFFIEKKGEQICYANQEINIS